MEGLAGNRVNANDIDRASRKNAPATVFVCLYYFGSPQRAGLRR
jgi:hypothetical protein